MNNQSFTTSLDAGSLILNARGVPGTLGCVVYSNVYKQYVFLTNYHVLFGKKAKPYEQVWVVQHEGDQKFLYPIGTSLTGTIGSVVYKGRSIFVDCAVGLPIDDKDERFSISSSAIDTSAEAMEGAHVSKAGGASKTTHGTIVSVAYHDVCNINDTIYQAVNQMLIKPAEGEQFSTKGDSGAAILNERKEIVGLLWGVTAKGEGIACPVGPILQSLDLQIKQY